MGQVREPNRACSPSQMVAGLGSCAQAAVGWWEIWF